LWWCDDGGGDGDSDGDSGGNSSDVSDSASVVPVWDGMKMLTVVTAAEGGSQSCVFTGCSKVRGWYPAIPQWL